jgi:alpha-D-xyloside xylohydrolase
MTAIASGWMASSSSRTGRRTRCAIRAPGSPSPRGRSLKIEYFQGGFDRGLRLCWRTPSQLAQPGAQINNLVSTYLPEGAEWYDFWTNEKHQGGQLLSKPSTLDTLPLYVRAGSIVPLAPVMQYATEKPDAPYEIRIYPGANASFTLYEDDNETYDYEKGKFATVDLKWDDASRTLTIGKRQGGFSGMTTARDFRIVIAAPGKAQGIPAVAEPDRVVRYQGEAIKLSF